jgi:hypothetical protein
MSRSDFISRGRDDQERIDERCMGVRDTPTVVHVCVRLAAVLVNRSIVMVVVVGVQVAGRGLHHVVGVVYECHGAGEK